MSKLGVAQECGYIPQSFGPGKYLVVAMISALGLASSLTATNATAQNIQLDVNELFRSIIQQPQQPQKPPAPAHSPPPTYAPPPSYTPPPKPKQRSSVAPAQVAQTQQMLNDLGFDAGPADGVAGRRTIDALNAFQLANGLTVTPSIDKQSLSTLAAIHRHTVGIAAPPTSSDVSPSFDCELATTTTELAICNNVALAGLDQQLASLYRQHLSGSGGASGIKDEQRNWLLQRNQCGGEVNCLLAAYAHRVASLSSSPQIDPSNQGHASPAMHSVPHQAGYSPSSNYLQPNQGNSPPGGNYIASD